MVTSRYSDTYSIRAKKGIYRTSGKLDSTELTQITV